MIDGAPVPVFTQEMLTELLAWFAIFLGFSAIIIAVVRK